MSGNARINSIPLDPFIGGAYRPAAGRRTFPTYDPSTGEVLHDVPVSDISDVDHAVAAAKRALTGEWADILPAERSRILTRVAAGIRAKAESLAEIESLDSGKPLREAIGDIETSARYFEYYAGMADKMQGDTIPLGKGYVSFTEHEPIGVTAHIIPWNFPLVTTSRGLAPALAAGSTAVVKPAEQTPLTALMLGGLMSEAGVPAGVVNILCGPGETTGAPLVAHPDVAHVTFTGSVATGKAVMRSAADHVASVTLELGGKSPVVVLADADMDQALEGTLKAIFTNAGQVCSAGSRLVIEKSCSEVFLAKLVEKIMAFAPGRGIDNPDIGPIISVEQLKKIDEIVTASVAEGAEVLAGGHVLTPPNLNGWFYAPTVLMAKRHSERAVQEEIFGPVLTVQVAEDFEHACALAEDTEFGLVAGIYTRDFAKAMCFGKRISAGQVFINQYFAGGVETPFGGTKHSGFGREKGLEALRAYYSVKTITARI